MSTTRHQGVGKSDSSNACEFAGEVKTLRGAKPCIFSGKVASVVAEVGSLGSLFPGLRASIWESCRQKCTGRKRELGFLFEISKGYFRKMRPVKRAQGCGESAICTSAC